MRDDLLLYYERELNYIRQMAADFAERYPKIASRLVLEGDKCEDPHVERLLESFAFLAARVHLKIDDEFPELTEAILGIVYPHFIRPIPSMSIVEFELDPEKGRLDQGLLVPAGSILYSKAVQGVPCKFRTCYDLTLYPVTAASAEFATPDRLRPALKATDAQYAIPVRFTAPGDVNLSQLKLDKLQLYLNGESATIHSLYEVLCSRVTRILVRNPKEPRQQPIEIPVSSLRPMGFEKDEGVLDYPGRSFLAYRMLQEFFAFPEKFFFLELGNLEEVLAHGFQNEFEVVFLISRIDSEETRLRLENGVNASSFRTAATPIINLFPQTCEPILLDQKKPEYAIVPDVRRMNALEIHSIVEVNSIDLDQQTMVTYEPFYSIRHAQLSQKQQTFYLASRRASPRANDDGTDMYLSLVDLSFRPIHPKMDSVTVKTFCTNRDLPSRLPFGNETGDFELELSAPLKRIIALRKPTATLRPAIGKNIYWRLVSHLSLNYLSLVEEGKEALQQILNLYNITNSPYSERVISGIQQLKSKRKFARLVSDDGIAFARGFDVEIEFDEEQFVGGGVYLFAAVLERFLANYASLNSFSQLTARTAQRKEPLRQWPPRAGQKILI
ncbi:type VI secretion system baseplate subunit TssF [Bryobacter aggregatus]|uniref:type VI secretion system baseplate subunit TssF n=1 Tax=Bryobacter aggregatus TaxID=360054 RepID=UPI0004E0FA69|nr:type VI secretion system baseplate subunit TssF [Bryobacter aggregatus]